MVTCIMVLLWIAAPLLRATGVNILTFLYVYWRNAYRYSKICIVIPIKYIENSALLPMLTLPLHGTYWMCYFFQEYPIPSVCGTVEIPFVSCKLINQRKTAWLQKYSAASESTSILLTAK